MKRSIFIPVILIICAFHGWAQDTGLLKDRNDILNRLNRGKGLNAFIENKGQWTVDAKFLAQLPGMDAWITSGGIVYDFYKLDISGNDNIYGDLKKPVQDGTERTGHVVRMNFTNVKAENKGLTAGSDNTNLAGTGKQSTSYNYFIGNKAGNWIHNAGLYDSVYVSNLYPGINARYYFNEGLRYDLILNPGANPGDIRINFEGATYVDIDKDGNLVMGTSLGEIKQNYLYAYQEKGGLKIPVKCSFTKYPDGTIGFDPEWIDRSVPLVIDPLIYSTFLGGGSFETAYGVALDGNGDAYITGYTTSVNFPATPGAYHVTQINNYDVFVSEISSDGSTLIYSTFIGSNGNDVGYGIALDSMNNAVITGYCGQGFPVTPTAIDTSYNGNNDIFITKLNSAGDSLIFSTYIGGTENDYAYGIALDTTGNIYITGSTGSPNFPVTQGAFQTSYHGGSDAFVMKIDKNCMGIYYSTLVAGTQNEAGNAIAVDKFGQAVITGYTFSGNFPVTGGVSGTSLSGGEDAFVTKLNANGSSLVFSTFIGGPNNDVANALVLDAYGNPIIAGYCGQGYPATTGSYDIAFTGTQDAFITKLNSTGTAIVFSTLLGAAGSSAAYGMTLDPSGNIVVAGITNSGSFPVTYGAYNETESGQSDVFISKLNALGNAMIYSTFIGGSANETVQAIAGSNDGSVVITGRTNSSNYPVTAGAIDTVLNGGWDVFATKIHIPSAYIISSNTICFEENIGSLTLVTSETGSYSVLWSNGAVTASQTGLPAGNYIATVTDMNGVTDIIPAIISGPSSPIVLSAVISPVTCYNPLTGSIHLSVSGGISPYSVHWSNGSTQLNISSLAVGSYIVQVTDNAGCIKTAIYSVSLSHLDLSGSISDCCSLTDPNGIVNLTVQGGVSPYYYHWSGYQTTQDIQNLLPGDYQVTVSDSYLCTATASFQVQMCTPFAITDIQTVNLNCTLVQQGSIILTVSGNHAPFYYLWNTGDTTSYISDLNPGEYSVTVTDSNGDQITGTATVEGPPLITVQPIAAPVLCNGNLTTVTVITSGGTPPYTVTGSYIVGAGNYTYQVTDAGGCQASATLTVTQPPVLNVQVQPASILCNGQTSDVTINATGGTPPYSGTGMLTLQAGNYLYSVSDTNGCLVTGSYTISEPAVLIVSAYATPILCNGNKSVVSVNASGGVPPYSGTGYFVEQEGNYKYFISDFNGCIDSAIVSITGPAPLEITDSVTESSGISNPDGAIDITVSGGTSPYFYHWWNNSTNEDIAGLLPGSYALTVTDMNSCEGEITLTVGNLEITEHFSEEYQVFNFPNPFSGFTDIHLSLPAPATVSMSVFNVSGEKTADVFSGLMSAGEHLVRFESQNLREGVYFLRINIAGRTIIRPLTVIR